MFGVVVKSTGSWLTVESQEGNIYNCKLKGKFRIKDIKATNPVAVGDNVNFIILEDQKTGLIHEILPRYNYLVRKATKLSKVSHIIAANIDQAFIITTLAFPRTSTGFIDRSLVTTEAYHIPTSIIFNKIDLYDDKLNSHLTGLQKIYTDAGYECVSVSALRGDNLIKLKSLLCEKKTLFFGHSGVGKSALINAIEPGYSIRTKELSGYHQVGMHTTTFAEMLRLTDGGYIIDTPGIKEFGLSDFNRKEIAERFPEIRKYMDDCRFNDCSHTHEPGCAIQKALGEGKISKSRFNNYLSILNDDYWKEIENDYRST
jgi:ribosome biogenesis GTPase / thiamine phosphate phosphatase